MKNCIAAAAGDGRGEGSGDLWLWCWNLRLSPSLFIAGWFFPLDWICDRFYCATACDATHGIPKGFLSFCPSVFEAVRDVMSVSINHSSEAAYWLSIGNDIGDLE